MPNLEPCNFAPARQAIGESELWPTIVVDGVFFQFNCTGIARVWTELLKKWSQTGFARHLLLLDRNGTAPKIPGIESIAIDAYDFNHSAGDARKLQQLCDRVGADLFISTYYTTPLTTSSILMVHDMIPEVLQFDLGEPCWREKRLSILHASKYIAVSKNTARDLLKFYPHIEQNQITVVPNGVSREFFPAPAAEVEDFKTKNGIVNPYFLLVGSRASEKNYKNASLLFQALRLFPRREEIEVVCVGGDSELERDFASLIDGTSLHILSLSDRELRAAYSGAIALIYPSLYEGFGLPIAEAMACGCPVITCRNSSLPEVGGTAVLYVGGRDPGELLAAMEAIEKPETRKKLAALGRERAKKFCWQASAEAMADVFMQAALEYRQSPHRSPIWEDFRHMQAQLERDSSNEQSPDEGRSPHDKQPFRKNILGVDLAIGPSFFPLISFISGILLLGISGIACFSDKKVYGFQILPELQERCSFVMGVNCLAIAMLLGILGFFKYVNAQILRYVRMLSTGQKL